MREQLLGYLLDALDADEREAVEAEIQRNPRLGREVELLHESLDPLRADNEDFDPPEGLASQTCAFVKSHISRAARVTMSPVVRTSEGSSWSLADLAVAASVFFAAAMLLFPALQQSRISARLASCQNNLRQLGTALTQYSDSHHGMFPTIEKTGNMASAGVYAVKLQQASLLDGVQRVICAASPLAGQSDLVYVPKPEELESARGEQLARMLRLMGGSYGYTLGYEDESGYHGVKNKHRASFAIMADMPPVTDQGKVSLNHGGCGQNVLYEDGHVSYLTCCNAEGCNDHIFLNEDGQVAAGRHLNDAVIGASQTRPWIRTVGFGN
jgi:hypothetical protein